MNNESKGGVENNHVATPTSHASTTVTATTINTAISSHTGRQQDEVETTPEMSAANEQKTPKDRTDNVQESFKQDTHMLNDVNNVTNKQQTASTSNTGTVEIVASHLQKFDKCVCTQDTLDDLQRALKYEAIFNSLLEQKVLAMKRDCEERKRMKRMKRKSLGRLLFSKKLFSSRKSISGRLEGQNLNEADHMYPTEMDKLAMSGNKATAKKIVARSHTVDEIEVASPASTESQSSLSQKIDSLTSARLRGTIVTAAVTQESTAYAEDSIASSTISNSSGKHAIKRNLLVHAQTHTPAAETMLSSSSSPDSRELPLAPQSFTLNGNGPELQASSLDQRTTYDTASLASGYDNARVHTSTLADDSLTSLRDSIESLSFASSRCTVSFGATEIIPEDTASYLYERVRAAKRLRVLEAKSISAQCSPIFPRHVTQKAITPATQITPIPQTGQFTTNTIASTKTTTSVAQTIKPLKNSATQTPQTRLLPKQVSYTDSMYGYVLNVDGSRNISRQNTSEDSANVTMSTMLNQSDSFSLQAPAYFVTNTPTSKADAANRNILSGTDRFKSRSASLLVVSGNRRNRPSRTNTLDANDMEWPTKQLEQLHTFREVAISNQPINNLDNRIIPQFRLEENSSPYYPTVISTKHSNTNATTSSDAKVTENLAQLNRMTSTSTASSVAPTGCCTTTKSYTKDREKQRFIPKLLTTDQSGSDDEYRKRKRKYKRYHRCSDPVLVYPTPSGLQHCVISMPSNEPSQFPFAENFIYDAQLDMELDKNDDLEQIVPSTTRKHRRHR